jgi:hypothetical protein
LDKTYKVELCYDNAVYKDEIQNHGLEGEDYAPK